MSSSSSSANSLRPAWHRGNQSGKGFQPPPTVSERGRSASLPAADGGGHSASTGTGGSGSSSSHRGSANLNAFAALEDDDDVAVVAAAAALSASETKGGGYSNSTTAGTASNSGGGSNLNSSSSHNINSSSSNNNNSAEANKLKSSNSRSEALRAATTTTRSMSTGSKATGSSSSSHVGSSTAAGGGGRRSLAELAARAPEPRSTGPRYLSSAQRSDSIGGEVGSSSSSAALFKDDAKVIRFTREKLLSMRLPPPAGGGELPDHLKILEGTAIVSDAAQDPVCWDPNFDAEVIWANVPRRLSSAAKGAGDGVGGAGGGAGTVIGAIGVGGGGGRSSLTSRTRDVGSSSGRWQRGVALPPPDQAKKAGSRDKDADSPNELWDDPLAGGAAADFSAFGAMPAVDGAEGAASSPGPSAADQVFDFDKMAEATRKFEEEMHGSRSRASSDAETDDTEGEIYVSRVDPKRPLATLGTTIRSGSGDDVNVFEDFDDPGAENQAPVETEEMPAIKSAVEDPSASSRLMSLIGVTREEPSVATASTASSAATPTTAPETEASKILSPWGTGLATSVTDQVIPLNPWGSPIVPSASESPAAGLDIQAHLRQAAELEQKKREAEELRRRQEEEAQLRLAQESKERTRQAALQQQQGVQSQVELVLMERISTILENNWGRSALVLILQTLHSEDARVIPLLSSVDALRALILRHPRRMTIRPDPAFGAEVAILVMTNAQWQQEQQQEARLRAQQEELRRREQQQRELEAQQKTANAIPPIIPNAPWYYSDPQNNIQGPFRGNEMRQWLEAGYFKGDLPISQNPTGPFRPLSAIFPNLGVAFLVDTAAEEAAAARAKAEAEEKQRVEAERERARQQQEAERARLEAERARLETERVRQEAEAKEAAERERAAKEAAERERQARARAAEEAERQRLESEQAAAKTANGGNESSALLKNMLGLSGQAAAPGSNGKQQETQQTTKSNERKTTKAAAGKNATVAQRASREQAPAASEPIASIPAPSSPAPSPSPAWGGAAQPVARKSMSEIQKEEARASAILAMQRQGPQSASSGSGWANVAAARTGPTGPPTAWSGAGKETSAAVAANSGNAASPGGGTKPRQQSATGIKPRPQGTQQPRSKSTSAVTEAFGSMSPALEKWCKEQMMKLNGTEDLTLASFCNTLNDPVEIRQYLTTYLGSTPQVNNFATEFINKKGLGSTKQEEWESTATTKKSRKKKSGGR